MENTRDDQNAWVLHVAVLCMKCGCACCQSINNLVCREWQWFVIHVLLVRWVSLSLFFDVEERSNIGVLTLSAFPIVPQVLRVCEGAVCLAALLLVPDQWGHPVSEGFPAPAPRDCASHPPQADSPRDCPSQTQRYTICWFTDLLRMSCLRWKVRFLFSLLTSGMDALLLKDGSWRWVH